MTLFVKLKLHGSCVACAPLHRVNCSRNRSCRVGRQLHVAASGSGGEQPPAKHCVVIECDGGLLDVHTEGHRVAFNKAFEELGYGCAQWHPAIYYDLLRMGDATGPGLVRTYYEIMGWPIMLSTKDRPAFIENVYNTKQRIFKQMAATGDIPLREGVPEFIDELLEDGIRPIIIAGTSSAPEDSVVSCAMLNLGPSRAFKTQVLYLGSAADVKSALTKKSEGGGTDKDDDDKDDDKDDSGLTLDQQMSAVQSQAKATAAKSFVRAVNLQTSFGAGMRMDPSLIAAKERSLLASPSFLAAVLVTMQVAAEDSVMVAASHSLMVAAKGAGMLVAGVPPSLAKRGGYEAMDAGFDGFGSGGGLSWRKLKSILAAKKS